MWGGTPGRLGPQLPLDRGQVRFWEALKGLLARPGSGEAGWLWAAGSGSPALAQITAGRLGQVLEQGLLVLLLTQMLHSGFSVNLYANLGKTTDSTLLQLMGTRTRF